MASDVSARKRRVTAADVARRAGCSQAAVSLWVTGKYEGRLNPEWQERIAAAVKELGYVPNRAARRLVTGGTPSASFIFPGAGYSFFGPVLNGVTEALGPEWDILFFDSRPGRIVEHAAQAVSSAISAETTGVILASPSESNLEDIAHATAQAIVVVDAPSAPSTVSRVAFDMVQAVEDAVAHLAALGHRQVGYISYRGTGLTLVSRHELLTDTLRDRGVSVAIPDLHVSGLDVAVTAAEFVAVWEAWKAAGVTAVLCGDERQAYGVFTAAHRLGLSIPDDLSVISFRDSDVAPLLAPSLSSIRLPALELGALAGRALTLLVDGEQPTTTLIPATYVPRMSTASPVR